MKFLTTICFLAGLILASSAPAQPARGWLYHNVNQHGGFYDIYACDNGDLVSCGFNVQDCITRVSAQGEEIWSIAIDNGRGAIAKTLIEADNGDIVVGGNFGSRFTAFRFTSAGQLIWRHDYGPGACLSVIELKNGFFALAGYSPNAASNARLIIINSEGEPIRDREYHEPTRPIFGSMREVEDGILIFGSYRTDTQYPFLLKVNQNGDEVWWVDYGQQYISCTPFNGIASSPDGGYGLVVMPFQANGAWTPAMLKVNSRGAIEWAIEFRNVNTWMMPCIAYIPDVGFLIGGGTQGGQALAICVSEDGNELWRSNYPNMGEPCTPTNFRGIVVGRDGRTYACGDAATRNDAIIRGMMFQLGWISWDPEIFYWEPRDTTLSLLRGDVQDFVVVAEDPNGGEVMYEWECGDSTGHDTLFTYQFNEVGAFDVNCRVRAGQREVTVHWRVTVSDLFITQWSPDTLNLTLVRGSFETFSIDSFRINEWGNVGYLWTLTDLENMVQREVSTDFMVDLDFPRGGNFALEGLIYSGEAHDQVIWNIDVNSTIHSYWPEIQELSVFCDSSLSFLIIPTNADSGATHYSWRIGDELRELNASEVTFQFPAIGFYNVYGIARVGDEVDSVEWGVTVMPVNGVNGRTIPRVPTEFGLSAFPNPFNSSITISYDLPTPGYYAIDVVDIQGRLVTRLGEGWKEAGSYSTVWDGSQLTSGQYMLKLKGPNGSYATPVTFIR